MRETERKQSCAMNWESVTQFAVTAMRYEAGVACVDLDSVILRHNPDEGYRLGPVLPHGRKLVKWLQQNGWRVVVLTSRDRGHQQILSHLNRNNVWPESVTNRKPYADAYFDDKAIRVPKNWR